VILGQRFHVVRDQTVEKLDRLWSQANPVRLDFGVERGGVHSQQARGARLMAAGLFQRPTNQIDFKAAHLIVEVDAAPQILHRADARAFLRATPLTADR
jgi:hypothetical protein